jgi:hypothetical protein
MDALNFLWYRCLLSTVVGKMIERSIASFCSFVLLQKMARSTSQHSTPFFYFLSGVNHWCIKESKGMIIPKVSSVAQPLRLVSLSPLSLSLKMHCMYAERYVYIQIALSDLKKALIN